MKWIKTLLLFVVLGIQEEIARTPLIILYAVVRSCHNGSQAIMQCNADYEKGLLRP